MSFAKSGRVLGVVAAFGLLCLLTAGCDTATVAACGPITIDSLDLNEGHLLAGASSTPAFSQNPPTSGPHIAGAISKGLQRQALTGVEQVSTLETGAVILQYATVSASTRARLAARATATVVVAPGRRLPAPIVATGWQRTMRCDRYDAGSIDRFVATIEGRYNSHTATATGS